ncbi:MAG: RnfH family protein [Ectothiorhodospiraceae bacterium]|jgi:hypothetical protein
MSADAIRVEVAYGHSEEQALVSVDLPRGATVQRAIEASGILERFPDIDLETQQVGVFSHIVGLGTVLRDRDRVEIYRPLKIDPKEMRRQRARQQKH